MKAVPSSIEPLESRIAPAALYSWLGVDGDTVTLKSSVGASSDLKALMEAGERYHFRTGHGIFFVSGR